MRYCPHCRRINEQWPDHCRYCGSTWGVTICRSGHPNPANAVYCGQCGSSNLTQPASGGKAVNLVFGLFRRQGRLKFLFKVAIPIAAIVTVTGNLPLFLPLLAGIYVLVTILKHTLGILPSWITGPMLRFYRSRRQEIESRAREAR